MRKYLLKGGMYVCMCIYLYVCIHSNVEYIFVYHNISNNNCVEVLGIQHMRQFAYLFSVVCVHIYFIKT